MMFVTITDGTDKKPGRRFTERLSELWQSNLFNNHIDLQVKYSLHKILKLNF